METEVSQSASTDTAAPALERSLERPGPDRVGRRDTPNAAFEPSAVSAAGRTLAALARWFLFIVLVVLAPVALIAWSVTARVTSLPQHADQAIESGLTGAARRALVDQLSAALAEHEDSPIDAGQLRPVIERSLSQDWFDEQLTLLADELDRWLGTSSDEPPDLVIDLTSVKGSLAADDQTLSLVTGAMDCDSPRCPSPESALVILLSEVPDEVALLTIGAESDTDLGQEILEARDRFQTIDRLIAMVPLLLAGALAGLVLLARRGSRIRWLGVTLVAIAVPVLAVATLLPGWASQWVSGFLPGEISLNRASLEAVFSWANRPAGSVALLMLLAGITALVASVALGLRRHHRA